MNGRKPCGGSGCILVLGGWCAVRPRAGPLASPVRSRRP
eukprot:CAMPEP_0172757612 /NCGR_PEP_ID=MMETSP1074-20121228/164178_1 /TAXON_ID=2916 /ORGANISM="Ceratium fusus, Strain PA161109" /LENGTH=38 /DNA_ID= /DNA_START= /DNA_END= /DNA_ORIENTATION=